MVLVLGSVATPMGPAPTGIVAATPQLPAPAVPAATDADAAGAMAVAADASPATAAMSGITMRWVDLMPFSSLPRRASSLPGGRSSARLILRGSMGHRAGAGPRYAIFTPSGQRSPAIAGSEHRTRCPAWVRPGPRRPEFLHPQPRFTSSNSPPQHPHEIGRASCRERV